MDILLVYLSRLLMAAAVALLPLTLLGQGLVKAVAGFRPGFGRVYLAQLLACVIGYAGAFFLSPEALGGEQAAFLALAVLSLGVLTALLRKMVRGAEGQRISIGQAAVVAIAQCIAAVVLAIILVGVLFAGNAASSQG